MTGVNYGNNTYIFRKYDPFDQMKKIHDSCRIFLQKSKSSHKITVACATIVIIPNSDFVLEETIMHTRQK